MPDSLRQGSVWYVNRKTHRITSNYYGRRYELSFHASDRARRERWRVRESATAAAEQVAQ